MAIRVIPDREHLKVGEHFARPEFTAAQVRRIRDGDRRRARKETFVALFCVAALMMTIRLLLDSLIANPKLSFLLVIKPYITFASFGLGISLLIGSILLIFRRRY